jgi:hypothetical protein
MVFEALKQVHAHNPNSRRIRRVVAKGGEEDQPGTKTPGLLRQMERARAGLTGVWEVFSGPKFDPVPSNFRAREFEERFTWEVGLTRARFWAVKPRRFVALCESGEGQMY